MRLNMGNRGGRWAVGSVVSVLLLTVMITCEHNAWADSSGAPAPGTPSAAPAAPAPAAPAPAAPAPAAPAPAGAAPAAAAPAAGGSPAAAAAAPTPVPPLSSPAMTGPLVMASPNEINLPKYAPFLSDLPAPIATLFDFDVNGVVSGLGLFQNRAVV